MSEKMREEFNEWYGKQWTPESMRDDLWGAWQASRAALVVDLPSMTNNGYEGFYRSTEVVRAMRDAGIKCK